MWDYRKKKANGGERWMIQNDDLRRIHILSAPSSNPEKRANSMDTFKFFMERYKVEPGARILLVTSCIYVPFQLMKFTELALAKGMKNIITQEKN